MVSRFSILSEFRNLQYLGYILYMKIWVPNATKQFLKILKVHDFFFHCVSVNFNKIELLLFLLPVCRLKINRDKATHL